MDAFQGRYKNGTNGTPDWRYFLGLYLIFRILAIATRRLLTTYRIVYRATCYSCASLFFGLLRPYKETWINYWDLIAFMLFSLGECIVVYDEHDTRSHNFSALLMCQQLYLWYISLCIQDINYCLKWPFFAAVPSVVRTGMMEVLSVGDVEREAYTDSQEGEPLLTAASDLGGRYSRDT